MLYKANLFQLHVVNVAKQLKIKLGFYLRNKACFSLTDTFFFLPLLYYGDMFYICLALSGLLYHSALHFITNARYFTHHWNLDHLSGWSSLSVYRQHHWYIFICKAINSSSPLYLSHSQFSHSHPIIDIISGLIILFSVPTIKCEFGKVAFSYNAPSSWNFKVS